MGETEAVSNSRRIRTVELAQLCLMEEDPVHVFIHLLQSDLFVVRDFAHEDTALCQLMSPLLFTRLVWNDLGYSKFATLQLTPLLARCVEDFHPQVSAPCRAHSKKRPLTEGPICCS